MTGTPTSYAELQASVLAWIDDSDANVDVTQCIALAETRFNRILNTPEMETVATLAASAAIDLPADFLEARTVHMETDPRVVLEPVSPAVLRGRWNAQSTGQPQVYALIANQMITGPAPDSAYDITLVYKAAIPALTDSATTNWLLAKYPDLYTVASLMVAEARGWNDSRAVSLKGWWDEIMEEVGMAGRRQRVGSAPRRLRSPVRGSC